MSEFPKLQPHGPSLRFHFFDLHTFKLSLTQLMVPLKKKSSKGGVKPTFVISPVMDGIRTDLIYVLQNNEVGVYSLLTGQLLKTLPSPLESKEIKRGITLDSIAIVGPHRHVVVSGSKTNKFYIRCSRFGVPRFANI